MTLAVTAAGSNVALAWSACTASGFNTYVVVRSLDALVSWPLLDANDTVIAEFGPGVTGTIDATASFNDLYFYRVFCALIDGTGNTVFNSTPAVPTGLPATDTDGLQPDAGLTMSVSGVILALAFVSTALILLVPYRRRRRRGR